MSSRLRVTMSAAMLAVLPACSYMPFGDRTQDTDAEPAATVVTTAASDKTAAAETPAEKKPLAGEAESASVKSDSRDGTEESQAAQDADIPADIPPNTFYVTSAVKNESHPFYGIGDAIGLVVNGRHGKELILVRGETYTFKIDTGVQHDFYLSTSSRGWGAATLAEGVKGNFTYDGVVTFTPGKETPDVVYYQCRNHKNMGSMIHVVNKGDEGKVKLGVKPADARSKKPGVVKSSGFSGGSAAKQKVRFAEMFINMSPATKRIEASSHAEAKKTLKAARDMLKSASKSLDEGNEDEALKQVDEALRLMTAAGKLVPNKAQVAGQKKKYEEQLEGVETFRDSYQRNYKMMVKKKGKANVKGVDMAAIDADIKKAKAMADKQAYVDANRLLHQVQRTLTGALTTMLDDEVMSYELNFETPAEEYEYELARYKSFEELIPIAIEQKRPPKQTVALMDTFVKKAGDIHNLALNEAKKKNYGEAILMLQGATSHLQRALRIAGVR